MAEERFTSEESRKLAVLVARIWADPDLAAEYSRTPRAVLAGAGIALGDRAVPEIPERPAEMAAQSVVAAASGSTASSMSCATCPCSGCTASCAYCNVKDELRPQLDAIMKLAESPSGREQARAMMAKWDIRLGAK